MKVFDRRILELLTFLTRKQAWLSAPEVTKLYRHEGKAVGLTTVYRWFSHLEEQAGLAYFPSPRMNTLGLADFHVRIYGLRTPAVLKALPFSHSFQVEIGLDGQAFVSQDYWIPASGTKDFLAYWDTAKDLGLVEGVDVLPFRNLHLLYSPLHEVLTEDGSADFADEVDVAHFEALVCRHLREPYTVDVGKRIAASPLVVPLILEHLWRHCSSRQVWQAIRAKGEGHILKYARGGLSKALRKPGTALRLLQQQWQDLLAHFDDVFLQPVVYFPPGFLRNCPLISFTVNPGSAERIAELAVRVGRRSVLAAVMPEAGPGSRCRIWCNPPSGQLPVLLRLMKEYHRGSGSPVFGLVDIEATRRLAQPAFCGFDWRAFDPMGLQWRFDGTEYVERLKGRPASEASGSFAPPLGGA